MLLSTRRPNRRNFRSTFRETQKRNRDYYYAAATILAVKILLFWFLCLLLYVSTKLFYYQLSDNPRLMRLAIPVTIILCIVILACHIIKSIKEIKNQSKNLH